MVSYNDFIYLFILAWDHALCSMLRCTCFQNVVELTTSEMLVNMSSSTLEEYYPAVAIATLMRIIRDPTLSQHHTMVVQVSFCYDFHTVCNYFGRKLLCLL